MFPHSTCMLWNKKSKNWQISSELVSKVSDLLLSIYILNFLTNIWQIFNQKLLMKKIQKIYLSCACKKTFSRVLPSTCWYFPFLKWTRAIFVNYFVVTDPNKAYHVKKRRMMNCVLNFSGILLTHFLVIQWGCLFSL